MATTLRDFIAARETEIRELQKALKAEARDLQIAKAALDGAPGALGPLVAGSPTIKDMAREVLSGQPGGLNSAGILDGIKKQFGRDIERTSLSPQLSRLKDDGELMLAGEIWYTISHWKALQERLWQEMPDGVKAAFDADLDDDDGVPPMPTHTTSHEDDYPF